MSQCVYIVLKKKGHLLINPLKPTVAIWVQL